MQFEDWTRRRTTKTRVRTLKQSVTSWSRREGVPQFDIGFTDDSSYQEQKNPRMSDMEHATLCLSREEAVALARTLLYTVLTEQENRERDPFRFGRWNERSEFEERQGRVQSAIDQLLEPKEEAAP